jgi:hypothetical protein
MLGEKLDHMVGCQEARPACVFIVVGYSAGIKQAGDCSLVAC